LGVRKALCSDDQAPANQLAATNKFATEKNRFLKGIEQ